MTTTPSFLINNGASTTVSTTVNLELFAVAAYMKVAEVASGFVFPTTAWTPYAANVSGFVLSSGVGTKRLIAQFLDASSNVSAVYEASIDYTLTVDDYTMILNEDHSYTYNGNVTTTFVLANASTVLAGLSSTSRHTIAAGYNSLAIKGDGTIAAFGTGGFDNSLALTLTDVVEVTEGAGYDNPFGAALKSDGTVVVFPAEPGPVPRPVGLTNVTAISSGKHILALKSDGTVVAWGANGFGECNVPVGLVDVIAVAAGTEHSVALRRNGTLVVWGSNYYGQTNAPAVVDAIAIFAGAFHSMVLRANGTVLVWGRHGFGTETVPANLTDVIAIAAGAFHCLALKRDGTVVGWGQDSWGDTIPPVGLTDVVEIATGSGHSLALKRDGSLVAWGSNLAGETTVPAGFVGVTLTVLVELASVYISEYADFSVRDIHVTAPIPPGTPFSYPFTVSAGEGVKTVYARLYNTLGIYTEKSVSIFLDQTSPAINPQTVSNNQIIVINPATGSAATNDPQVIVGFQGLKSSRAVIASIDSGFSGAAWQSYIYFAGAPAATIPLTLDTTGGDGLRYVYVKFSDDDEVGGLLDAVGTTSATYIGEILYSISSPSIPIVIDNNNPIGGDIVTGLTNDGYYVSGYPNAIVINNGDATVLLEPITVGTVSRFYVSLTLNALEATEMRLSTVLAGGAIPGGTVWIPYQHSLAYSVPETTGILTVYVEFRNVAHNTTSIYYSSIEVVDGRPVVPGPLGPFAILIEGGTLITSLQTVSLLLNAENEATLEMIISESSTFITGVWEPYQTFKNYTFRETKDGTKVVFVKFRIKLAGLYYRESAAYSASIVKDTTPPAFNTPPILINAGATFTRDRTVAIAVNVNASAVLMQVINEADYTTGGIAIAPWVAFKAQFSWLLSTSNGEKRVYVRLRDEIGNTTTFVSAGIKLNSEMPQAPVITSPLTGSVMNQRIIKVTGIAEPGAIVTVTVKPIR